MSKEYLKIKDDVDLKELEKFGFKPFTRQCGFINQTVYDFFDDLGRACISIYSHLRIVELNICFNELDDGANCLFDLIQAGLVEKVVEEI